jgi:hypothetical protein
MADLHVSNSSEEKQATANAPTRPRIYSQNVVKTVGQQAKKCAIRSTDSLTQSYKVVIAGRSHTLDAVPDCVPHPRTDEL